MLLRSISKHVTSQNWFAVALDLVIVVAGVFIGLQVSNWNDERLLQHRVSTLIERLEIDFGADVRVAMGLHQYHQQVFEDALLVLNDINGSAPMDDEEFLISAYRATQFNRFNGTSIYETLISSGGLELVGNSELGRIASLFYETTTLSDYEQYGQSSEYRQLYRSTMPIEVQLAVSSACGDRALTLDQVMKEEPTIGYDCELDLPLERMVEAAAILREDPAAASALRHRAATLATQNTDFGVIIEAIRPFAATREQLVQSAQFRVWVDE
jgi:hypothetical protein